MMVRKECLNRLDEMYGRLLGIIGWEVSVGWRCFCMGIVKFREMEFC